MLALLFLALFILPSANLAWAEDDEFTKKLKTDCAAGDGVSCYRVGERYRIIETDNKTALEWYFKACNANDMGGCNSAGILTQMLGKQYSPEWKTAAELFQKACDAKVDRACFNLGSLKYREGRAKAALKYYTLACEMDNKIACENIKKLDK
ncbi:MAG: hypothetical protein COV67_09725 [Nitrospinae bacterium CG11_big_fil_rev_8_21_14_0_20_56_8]|nr:MAG: hypothetical protein COV67_09725 [Nitrospinae bacterium CG11_big_fil_rev_8_21_14_0_20_56_8]